MSLAAFLCAAFFAQIVGTLAGFGAATILTPVAFLFMDIKAAIAMVAFFHLLGNLSKTCLFRRTIRWTLFWQFGLASILFTAAGAWLAARTPSNVLTAVFGGFLVVYVIVSWAFPRAKLPGDARTAVAGGISSGFVAGLIGTGGAIRGAFLLAFGLPKEAYIATSAVISLVIDSTRLPVYFLQGFITPDDWPMWAGLIVMAFTGAWVGKKLVSHIPQEKFRVFILILLLVMGARMLWSGLT